MDFEVVLYQGMVREKPTSKEEARRFIKGLLNRLPISSYNTTCFSGHMSVGCRLFWWSCSSYRIYTCNQPCYRNKKRGMGESRGTSCLHFYLAWIWLDSDWWMILSPPNPVVLSKRYCSFEKKAHIALNWRTINYGFTLDLLFFLAELA